MSQAGVNTELRFESLIFDIIVIFFIHFYLLDRLEMLSNTFMIGVCGTKSCCCFQQNAPPVIQSEGESNDMSLIL